MNDVIVSAVVILAAAGIVGVLATLSRSRADRHYVFVAFAMHMVFAFALRVLIDAAFGGVADIYMFLDRQQLLRPMLLDRPLYGIVEIAKLIFQLPNDIMSELDSTSSIIGVTALGMWSLNDSVYALFFGCAFLGFLGKWGIYATLRDELGLKQSVRLAVCCMMIPSCVFWTSGLVKEAFAVCGLGALTRGAQLLLRRWHRLEALPLIIFGFGLTGAFKPFLLFGFVIALGVWIFFEKVRTVPYLTPVILIVAVAVAVLGFALLGARYKAFAFDRLAESVATTQGHAQVAGGGSSYALGNPADRTMGGQIVFAPIALITVLMRPLPFEVHNASSAVAAAELLFLNLLLVRRLSRTGLRAAWRNLFRQSILLFSFTFVLTAGTGIGLATGNFGTLSRYRTPVLPFYAVVIAVGLSAVRAKDPTKPDPSRASRLLPRHVLARRKNRRASGAQGSA